MNPFALQGEGPGAPRAGGEKRRAHTQFRSLVSHGRKGEMQQCVTHHLPRLSSFSRFPFGARKRGVPHIPRDLDVGRLAIMQCAQFEAKAEREEVE
jgi:hypothetical protein